MRGMSARELQQMMQEDAMYEEGESERVSKKPAKSTRIHVKEEPKRFKVKESFELMQGKGGARRLR